MVMFWSFSFLLLLLAHALRRRSSGMRESTDCSKYRTAFATFLTWSKVQGPLKGET
ncbi:hypothetical protein PtrM4_119570 [Pyrenophora tritici-repentis]|uniref:Uncharacterized protein n=1 Tax=Pyrenophora tritici-repentis TaxID=45151 RepID=A0A834VPQ9_9PLEO|nr:hypothetical protein PtrM4_119570 [Pyrenophora tritici-repentis]